MTYSPNGIRVFPNGQSAVVTFTLPNGATPAAYSNIQGSATISLPATITTPTTFYFVEATTINVSALVGSQQSATTAGTTAAVDLSGGGVATLTVAVIAASGSSLPSQTGNGGKFLQTDGTNPSWATALVPANNLSDVSSITVARSNLGLGTAATQNKVAAGSAGVLDATDASTTNARTPTTHASTHASAGSDPITIAESQVTNLTSDLAAKAPLASPALTGNPTAPTQSVGDNSTKLATTAYVDRGATLNTQTGTSYTLVLADGFLTTVEMNNASANTLTVPPNSSVAFPVGTTIGIRQYGAGQTTVTPGAGVTIRSRGSALKTNGQYAEASIQKRATDEWVLTGDVTP